MSFRNFCLDVLAYLLIAVVLLLGAKQEWKTGQKTLAVVSVIVAVLMVWEGFEKGINHCKVKNPA